MYKSPLLPKPVTEYDIRLLRVFKTIVECGGFSAAESELNITRSTISVHMMNLEQRIGMKLCNRGRGGFSLTPEGQQAYEAMRGLFNSLDEFSLKMASIGGDVSGELNIQCSDEEANNEHVKLDQVIALMMEKHPDIHMSIEVGNVNIIEQNLLTDKIHLGILPQFRAIEGLQSQLIYQEPIYLYCGEGHDFFNLDDKDISEQDINAAPAVYPGIDVTLAGRGQLKQMNLAAKAYQYDARISLVRSGKFLGFFPKNYAKPWEQQGKLKCVHSSTRFYDVGHHLISKSSSKEPSKISAFMEVWHSVHS